MIPTHFIQLEELPLTPNGKIDRKALSRIGNGQPPVNETYVPPGNETEKKLQGIWQEVLGREKIGIDDNFNAVAPALLPAGDRAILYEGIHKGVIGGFIPAVRPGYFTHTVFIYGTIEVNR